MTFSTATLRGAFSFRRQATLLLAVIAMLVSVMALSPAAHAGPGEGDFFNRANSARATYRIRGYVSRADLVTVARRHAERMAAQKRIFHNPNLSREVTGWRAVGENVGMGTDVAPIHNAFMRSTSHRANILDKGFGEVGMGTARDSNGRLYIVQVFRQR
ncbi:MAG TPA: CAP domain-containing protein [Mycobacteriales bacterium]|nr:CAP domain-containing protein [Mycobacteriales bacterium]